MRFTTSDGYNRFISQYCIVSCSGNGVVISCRTEGRLNLVEFQKVHDGLKDKELLRQEACVEDDWDHLSYGKGYVNFNDFVRWMGVIQA